MGVVTLVAGTFFTVNRTPAGAVSPDEATAIEASMSATREAEAAAASASAAAAAIPPPRVQVADAMARLSDPARPFSVAIFGDSTGVSRRGWVVQMGEQLGERFDRTVVINPWSVEEDPDAYVPSWTVHRGSGAPITIWNASASGTAADYPSTRMDELVPVPSDSIDVVIASYGHNQIPGTLVRAGDGLMDDLFEQFTQAPIVGILQNPEKPGSANVAGQDENVADFAVWLTRWNYTSVDVHEAFVSTPGWEQMFAEGSVLHPSEAGYTVWANTVMDALVPQGA